MDGDHVVHDISSDEDGTFNWAATEAPDNDIDWNNLLVNLQSGEDQNCDGKGYDSDDVVVVREVLPNPKRAKKASAVSNLVAQDLNDDDCVILDGDPDKHAAVEDSGPDSGGDSDDLVIVGEKGQVACRDYPHSRHLCVNFPFDSTLHSDHCKLCHCYVCDSPAPCGNWVSSNMMIDHCHANEKEEFWKSERKRAKLEKSASVASSTDTSFWRDLLKHIPTPTSVLPQNYGIQSCLPGQAQSFGMPSIIRSPRTGCVSGRHGFHSNLPTRQQLNPCSNNPQRARGTSLGHVSPTSLFKRTNRPLLKSSVPSNSSLNNFRNAYASNLAGIRLASSQANVRQLHEFHTGFNNGAVNSNALQSSSELSANQTSSAPTLSQGHVDQYSHPCLHPKGDERPAPISSTTHSNTSDVQAEQQLPLIEEKPSYYTNPLNPDFSNLEVNAQFLNDLPPFDFEDVQLLCITLGVLDCILFPD
ncbi:hypothetical protein V2J09_003135 [Rumex salicifolius]